MTQLPEPRTFDQNVEFNRAYDEADRAHADARERLALQVGDGVELSVEAALPAELKGTQVLTIDPAVRGNTFYLKRSHAMTTEEVQEVRAVRKKSEANDLIAQGWKLIGQYERSDAHDQYIEYHLGLPKGPPRLVNTKDGFV